MKLYAPAYQDTMEPWGWEPHENRLYLDRVEAEMALEKLREEAAQEHVRFLTSRAWFQSLTGEERYAEARAMAEADWGLQEYEVRLTPEMEHGLRAMIREELREYREAALRAAGWTPWHRDSDDRDGFILTWRRPTWRRPADQYDVVGTKAAYEELMGH